MDNPCNIDITNPLKMDQLFNFTAGDEAVKATNDDASECKRCAVELGYWRDDYIRKFIKQNQRKAPEINRGYYARVKGVEIFIHQFLERAGSRCQIINLGCGYDTLYWRLRDSTQAITNFVDLDFPSVTSHKCFTIKKNKTLMDKINVEDGEIIIREGDLHSDSYHLLGCDLRCLPEVKRKLECANVKPDLPTLFLAECVLVYLKPEPCENLLTWLSNYFTNAMFVNYEQVNLADKFGEVMIKNLSARGCPLSGEKYCRTLQTQNERFLTCGWTSAESWDMQAVWLALPEDDRLRVESLEMLDERELLVQLFQHYCIAVAWKGPTFDRIDLNA